MSLILAIDQSTSATKAVLFDPEGRLLEKAARGHRQIYPQPGWVEHDADEIWANTIELVREIAGRSRVGTAAIAALSITNQRETIVVWDRATGRPLHPAIVWQCRRGAECCEQMKARGYEERVRAKTGLRLDTYFSASKLHWLIEHRPEIARRLRNGEAVAGTVDAYLIFRLTRGAVFATDVTNASRTLLFHLSELRWDLELCEWFGVPLHALPQVRESSASYGETDADGALPVRVPIMGVMGDSQAALFAQGCFQTGSAKATFGTGTSVLCILGPQPGPPTGGIVTALAWVWQGRPTYAAEGLINFSAATIAWLQNQLELIDDAAEAEKLASSVSDTAGVYLVPAFTGLSAPHWAPAARGAIVGLTPSARREHVVRAALEAIAFQLRDVLDRMGANGGGGVVRKLHADGGPTGNAFLMQFAADLTRTELCVSEIAEASARGAAMNAMLGLGWRRSLDELATLSGQGRSYLPRMPAAQAKQLHDGWLAAVARVL